MGNNIKSRTDFNPFYSQNQMSLGGFSNYNMIDDSASPNGFVANQAVQGDVLPPISIDGQMGNGINNSNNTNGHSLLQSNDPNSLLNTRTKSYNEPFMNTQSNGMNFGSFQTPGLASNYNTSSNLSITAPQSTPSLNMNNASSGGLSGSNGGGMDSYSLLSGTSTAASGTSGFKEAMGSKTAGGVAVVGSLAANIGGGIWKNQGGSNGDLNYTTSEKWGDVGGTTLSNMGQYAGMGMSIGSLAGPVGMGIGALAGGIVGTGVGLYQGITGMNAEESRISDQLAVNADIERKKKLSDDLTASQNAAAYGSEQAKHAAGFNKSYNSGNMIMNMAAYGGTIDTGVTGDDQAITEINEGGSHEQNPLGGVPMGSGSNGVPNSVEANEVKVDFGKNGGNYIFSDRLT